MQGHERPAAVPRQSTAAVAAVVLEARSLSRKGETVAPDAPNQGGRPEEDDETAPATDAMWCRFLNDTEQAIRASAPRELSAHERMAGMGRDPSHVDGAVMPPQWRRRTRANGPAGPTHSTVGELWQAEDSSRRTAWRYLDSRAKCRRTARVLCAIVAVVLAVAALSRLPPAPDSLPDRRGEDASRRSGVVLPDGVSVETALPSEDSLSFRGEVWAPVESSGTKRCHGCGQQPALPQRTGSEGRSRGHARPSVHRVVQHLLRQRGIRGQGRSTEIRGPRPASRAAGHR